MVQQPQEKLMNAFFNTLREIRRQFTNDSTVHLSVGQMEALFFVNRQKKVLMKELADFLAITPPSTTFLANHLVSHGWLKRKIDSLDRRLVYLVVSPKGKKMLLKARKEKSEIIRKLLSRLNSSEQRHLLQLLEKMSAQDKK